MCNHGVDYSLIERKPKELPEDLKIVIQAIVKFHIDFFGLG